MAVDVTSGWRRSEGGGRDISRGRDSKNGFSGGRARLAARERHGAHFDEVVRNRHGVVADETGSEEQGRG